MSDLTIGIAKEWKAAFAEGEDVPDTVMKQIFELAIEKLQDIENGE